MRPIGIRMGGDFKSLFLLEFYSDWLETLGKYSWHIVLLYTKLWKKKNDFSQFQNPCNPLNQWIYLVKTLANNNSTEFQSKIDKIYFLYSLPYFYINPFPYMPPPPTYKLLVLYMYILIPCFFQLLFNIENIQYKRHFSIYSKIDSFSFRYTNHTIFLSLFFPLRLFPSQPLEFPNICTQRHHRFSLQTFIYFPL